MGVLLRAQVEEGQDPGGPDVGDGQTRLRDGREAAHEGAGAGQAAESAGQEAEGLVLAQISVAGLELEESAREEEDPPEDVHQLVEEDVEERVRRDGRRAEGRLVVDDHVSALVHHSAVQVAAVQQKIPHAHLRRLHKINFWLHSSR